MPAQTQVLAPLAEKPRVIARPGPAVEPVSHSPESLHAIWLEVLGPSITAMLASGHLARTAAGRPGDVIGRSGLARSLGRSKRLDEDAPVPRAVARTVAFGAENRTGATLAVGVALPDVRSQQRRRLSMSTQLAHEYRGHRQCRPASATPGPVGAEVGL
jgi:hypothetical protein